MRINRRDLLWGAASIAASSALPSRLALAAGWDNVLAAAKTEGKVVYYSSGIAKVEEQQMSAFSKATGINVAYARPGGGEIVLRKFEQEVAGGVPLADICSLTDYALATYAKERGWVEPVDLPNMAHLDPSSQVTDPGVLPTGSFAMVIAVNTNLLKESDWPKSYKDLIDPKYKGKILFGAPENAGSTTVLIQAFLEKYGWDFVTALRTNDIAEMRLQAEAMQAVARGEKPVCVVSQQWAFLSRNQKAPIAVIFPKDGTVFTRTAMFVAKNAPSPAAAKVLANYLLSKEYQDAMVKFTGSYGSAAGLPAPEGFEELSAINKYYPDLDKLAAQRGEIISRWRKIMS